MMTLTISKESISVIDKINRYCLVSGVKARCHVSQVTGSVIFAFKVGEEPKNLEDEGVKYEEVT